MRRKIEALKEELRKIEKKMPVAPEGAWKIEKGTDFVRLMYWLHCNNKLGAKKKPIPKTTLSDEVLARIVHEIDEHGDDMYGDDMYHYSS